MSRSRPMSRRSGVARGKMFLADRLSWLSGYPLSLSRSRTTKTIRWQALPRFGDRTPQIITLGRDELHRGMRTWTKLLHRFPHALPQIVPDLGWWQEGVPHLLTLLSEAVHRGTPLPADLWAPPNRAPRALLKQIDTVMASHADLTPLWRSLSWSTFLYPEEGAEAIRWATARASTLASILQAQGTTTGLATIHSLWTLVQNTNASRVESLLMLYGQPGLWEFPSHAVQPYLAGLGTTLRRRRRNIPQPPLPERPKATTEQTLQAFTVWLLNRNRRTQQTALDLWTTLEPQRKLKNWQEWWQDITPLLNNVTTMAHVPRAPGMRRVEEELLDELVLFEEHQPPALVMEQLLADIQEATKPGGDQLYRHIIDIVQLLPAEWKGRPVRHTLFNRWMRMSERPYRRQWIRFILPIMYGVIEEQHHRPRLLQLWQQELTDPHDADQPRYGIEDLLRHTWSEPTQYAQLIKLLIHEELPDDPSHERITTYILGGLLRHAKSIEKALHLFKQLHENELLKNGVGYPHITLAYRIADDDDDLIPLLNALVQSNVKLNSFVLIGDAVTTLQQHGWAGIGKRLVLHNQLHKLLNCGSLLGLLVKNPHPTPPPPSPLPQLSTYPPQFQRYPDTLQPALRLLTSLYDDNEGDDEAGIKAAQATVNKILGKNFPDPAHLQREIAVLKRKLAADPSQEGLRKRLHSLEKRLATPKKVSVARLSNLEEKLQVTIDRLAVERWETDLLQSVTQWLETWLGETDLPAWMYAPEQIAVLTNLGRLSASFQQLARDLFLHRIGPPPWRPFELPANQRFVQQMRAADIDMEAWLNPPPPRQVQAANDRQLILAITADPLEIFQMGAHFNTCLSPNQFNFFSVFTNAADINKHVLYAYDEAQKVVGRCLLALNDQGALLTFYPYSHDGELKFDQLVAQFADQLAERMETVVTETGRVSPLVPTEWYDDGARALTERFAFLSHDHPFRVSLHTLQPDQFYAALQEHFAPLPFNALTLPLILELSELTETPNLIVPLLPHIIENEAGIPDNSIVAATLLAQKAGEVWFVEQLVEERLLPYCYRYSKKYWERYRVWPILRILSEVAPWQVLTYLRRTRSKRVKRDQDERGVRRELLIATYRHVGRTVRAERLEGSI